jgi:hypothetical protein
MKHYSNGEHVVLLTERTYNIIYKDLGYLEVESSKYNREDLEKMTFNELFVLFQNETSPLVNNRPMFALKTKEKILNDLLRVDLKLKENTNE